MLIVADTPISLFNTFFPLFSEYMKSAMITNAAGFLGRYLAPKEKKFTTLLKSVES